MGLNNTLYTKTATKNGLAKLLKANGFQNYKHVIDELNNGDFIHFHWFGFDDYESFSGVEATITKSTKEDKLKYKCSEWILSTRTNTGGSRIDKKKQNDIIRVVRKKFGGTFYNDYYGTNRYTNLDDYDNLSAPERGLFLMSENLVEKVAKIRMILEHHENPYSKQFDSMPDDNFGKLMRLNDPNIILFNSLLPFLVSLIEYLFGEAFKILIKYDLNAQKIIAEDNIKISIQDVISVKDGNLDIEEIVSRNYTFQNLSHVNKAYKKYLNIDILKVLSKKKKVNKKIFRLREKLEEIINQRHQMIHHFNFDPDITKETFNQLLSTIDITSDEFFKFLEKKNNWKIKRYGYH